MHLIHNYGLFWKRDKVTSHNRDKGINDNRSKITDDPQGEWPSTGKLLGVGVGKKRKGVVDFASQRGIYALYDDHFRLVYVGQVGRGKRRLYRRLRIHSLSVLSARWTRFSWFGIMPLEDEPNSEGRYELDEKDVDGTIPVGRTTILDHVEAVAILIGEPLRNKKSGIFGSGVTHYRQAPNGDNKPEIDDDDEDVTKENNEL